MKNITKKTFLENLDLKYCTEYEYRTERECDTNPDACKDDYCRCGKIVNPTVESVDLEAVASNITQKFYFKKDKEYKIAEYFVERFLVLNQLYNPDSWEIEVDPGYYGEEIGKITFSKELAGELYDSLTIFSSNELIERILRLEYSFLTAKVENKNWSVQTLPLKSIVTPSTTQSQAVKRCRSSFYKDRQLPLGIVIKDQEKYSLVDGYHRLSENNQKEFGLFVVGE